VTSSFDSLAAALSDQYRLERELGQGGMATVYLARDLKHDRPVALKVLRPELAASLGPERFQREVRLAARLQHPHILTVLDSGQAAGRLWFTMPFVEGESLRDRLDRERHLPVEDAIRIAREAAQALQYAHEQGVVHRDIKPENILLTRDGSTLVADFGIARALGSEDGRLTETGLAVGTPAYMSPEQASGDKAVDARTDIYSLGGVLYEMLAGELPFTGPTMQAVIVKRLTEAVPSVRKARPAVPEAVAETLQRALAPLPADRFATAGDFARALSSPATPVPSAPVAVEPPPARRRIPAGLGMLVIGFAIGLGLLFAWRLSRPTDGEGQKVLAVLPFENLGDSADAYFADGITDEVRGKLATVPGLAVIARASSNEYRKSGKTTQEVARELGADYLLTATVRWEKRADGTSRVRVSPELIRVAPGATPTTQWQEPFDAALTDVFQVQAEMATRVAAALNVVLADSVRREVAAKPTENLAAYDAFLKGEALSQGGTAVDPLTIRRVIPFYEQAVTIDPRFVQAWAQLSRAYALLYYNASPDPVFGEQARQAAERARALAPDRVESYRALTDYYSMVVQDPRQAYATAEAGLKLFPNDVDMLVSAALAEESLNRWDDALRHLTRAGELDPRAANMARRTGQALLWLRRYPEARAATERALALTPTSAQSLENASMVFLAQGDLDGARGTIRAGLATIEPDLILVQFGVYWDLYWVLDDDQQQRLLAFPPDRFDNDRGMWGIVRAQLYHLRGDDARARIYADSARQAYEVQLKASPTDAQRTVLRGLALAYMGRKREAIESGERAVQLQSSGSDAYSGSYNEHQLARIYLMVGEPEKALDLLEGLLGRPYYLSPGWLRIDPTFAPLRGNPRFERLAAG